MNKHSLLLGLTVSSEWHTRKDRDCCPQSERRMTAATPRSADTSELKTAGNDMTPPPGMT
jgi:hypothetical protein